MTTPLQRLENWRLEKPDMRQYSICSPTYGTGQWRVFYADGFHSDCFYRRTMDAAIRDTLKQATQKWKACK